MNRKKKMGLDVMILLISCAWVGAVWYYGFSDLVVQGSILLALLIGGVVLIDVIRQYQMGDRDQRDEEIATTSSALHELILLNEQDKPIRSWNLSGKTAMVIGRTYRDEVVDVDLGDCEYSALINIQHAVLNYCLDSWYLEDLNSKNGIRIQKVEDGICYQITQSRPCKISAGDVIYIAKTKLLFT